MSKSSLFSMFSVVALSLGLAASAGATTFSISNTMPTGYGYDSFASTLAGSTNLGGVWSGTGGVANTTVINSYCDPILLSCSATGSSAQKYAFAEAGQTVSVTFATPLSALWLAWGSPDTYNTITINGTAYTATAVGLTTNQSLTQFVQISGPISSLSFASSQNSFEFDDLIPVASPEPASIALLAGGLLAIGAGAIRRRKA